MEQALVYYAVLEFVVFSGLYLVLKYVYLAVMLKKTWQYNSVSQFVDQTAHMNNTCLCMY